MVNSELPIDTLPTLVVLIPTHNRLKLLERAVDSVLACRPPPGRPVRLVVVENGGRFGVDDLLAGKDGWIKAEYFYFDRPNKSDALNSFVGTLDDALILFLDDDVRVHPEILVHYSNAARNPAAGRFYGGGMLIDYEEPPPAWLIDYLPPSARGWSPEKYSGVTKDLAFMGCNWAAHAADIRKAGGFNPQLGPGGTSGGAGQEQAMQLALRQEGLVADYVRDAVVWHYVPKSRCSPRWSLQRTYRNAITTGRSFAGNADSRRLAGVPYWIIRRAVSEFATVIKSRFQSDSLVRYKAMSNFLATLGRIKGIRAKQMSSGQS